MDGMRKNNTEKRDRHLSNSRTDTDLLDNRRNIHDRLTQILSNLFPLRRLSSRQLLCSLTPSVLGLLVVAMALELGWLKQWQSSWQGQKRLSGDGKIEKSIRTLNTSQTFFNLQLSCWTFYRKASRLVSTIFHDYDSNTNWLTKL